GIVVSAGGLQLAVAAGAVAGGVGADPDRVGLPGADRHGGGVAEFGCVGGDVDVDGVAGEPPPALLDEHGFFSPVEAVGGPGDDPRSGGSESFLGGRPGLLSLVLLELGLDGRPDPPVVAPAGEGPLGAVGLGVQLGEGLGV